MNIRPFGERALLVEVASLDAVLALHARLEASAPDGITDLVPAARTVLVRFDPAVISRSQVRTWIERTGDTPAADASAPPALVELDIVYDGPDLDTTAELLGMSAEALAAEHLATEWTVAFTGFAPGFGYLVGDGWGHRVPRLESPRTRVPVGAVGLADEFCGAYPRETPGGWRLIGTTRAPLFDPDASPPALLAPGARVRFVERAGVGGSGIGAAVPEIRRIDREQDDSGEKSLFSEQPPVLGHGFRVIEPGLLATVQDLGRDGLASFGIARSGAFDRAGLRTANRLVGNPESAAVIEVTMGGFRAVAETDLWISVTGAWGPMRIGGRAVDPYVAHPWAAGAELHVDWFSRGSRAYLAVRGGIETAAVAGSTSTDLLAGLGPLPLAAGRSIRVGPEPAGPVPVVEIAPWGMPEDIELDVPVAAGPRADWFEPAALSALFEAVWTVSNQADRVGIRFEGPQLARSIRSELPSEGMLPGALQVPPSGRPVMLGVDGPVTGGYPVIAVVTEAGLDLLAQARAGTRVRFRHA